MCESKAIFTKFYLLWYSYKGRSIAYITKYSSTYLFHISVNHVIDFKLFNYSLKSRVTLCKTLRIILPYFNYFITKGPGKAEGTMVRDYGLSQVITFGSIIYDFTGA